MTGGTLSGGVVIALAAALWLAYLVPTWLRRRDYLNAERNAVRLQQTLRILAETAEMPEEVRVEATAREVARQQKVLKRVRAKADAAARAHETSEARAAARLAARPDTVLGPVDVVDVAPHTDAGRTQSVQPAPATREERERNFVHAVRRTRLATTGVAIASFVGIGFGVHSLIADGSWGLFAASAALLICAFAVLRRLAVQVAAHQAARRTRVESRRVSPELYDHALQADDATPAESVDVAEPGWQPQPLPKPLYQSPGSRAAAAMASVDAAVALRRAAVRAELEERAARIAAAQVTTLPVAAVHPATTVQPSTTVQPATTAIAASVEAQGAARPPSRYAGMGLVDDALGAGIDLDEALRRRRAVS